MTQSERPAQRQGIEISGEPDPLRVDPDNARGWPLAKRYDLLTSSHPTNICRRDREAIMAALEVIDELKAALAVAGIESVDRTESTGEQ